LEGVLANDTAALVAAMEARKQMADDDVAAGAAADRHLDAQLGALREERRATAGNHVK
jgi:hypothetical protein